MKETPESASTLSVRPQQALGEINILRIEPDLARIVDQQQGGRRLFALMEYLRQLTNARAVLLIAPEAPDDVAVLEQLWVDPAQPPEGLVSQILGFVRAPTEVPQAVLRKLEKLPGTFLVATPVTRPDKPRVFACLVLTAEKVKDLEPFLIILQTAAGFLHAAIDRQDTPGEWALRQATALVELGTLTGETDDFDAAARVLTEQLQRHVECFRVCLGVWRRGAVHLAAISGVAQFDKHGATTTIIQSAMAEALSQKNIVDCSAAAAEEPLAEVAHQELRRLLELNHVLSLPLYRAKGKPLAVLTFFWDAKLTPKPETKRLLDAATPYLQAQVQTLLRADPFLPVKWWNRWWQSLEAKKKQAVMIAAGAVGLLLLWPFPQHISVPCQVQPVAKRVVAAPFDGTLKEAKVEPGEIVQRGTVLALMDEKELRWKEAELQAARDRSLKMRDKSMTDSDSQYATSQMAQLEAEQHELDLRVVQYKIEHLEIQSPVDGVVLAGDLKRAEGVPVSKGQVLFEVAPLDRLVVEMDIPDGDIAYVKDGMDVYVRLEAVPGDKWSSAIRKVNPQSEVRDGKNIFKAEANLPVGKETQALRPGMKGKAVIVGHYRPLIWLLTYRLVDFFRMFLFW